MPRTIRGVLFDMDGVLIDAKEWHYEALNRALRLLGMEIPRDIHLSTFDGLPTMRKLAILSETRGLPPGLHTFINELKQTYTLQIAHTRCRPALHHQYALSRLRREGYRMAVCSNSVRNSVRVMMELAGLAEYLDLFLSNQDVSKPKPDPEMYRAAMARLGLQPWECLIVEDNENGIRAARASGGHVMVVNSVDEVTYSRIQAAIVEAERDRNENSFAAGRQGQVL
ncbi:MAG: HAD family phosphatase [Rhodospirillales bacterium]|nr:HAD family phosphatase [Rhodospirillales bacterium]